LPAVPLIVLPPMSLNVAVTDLDWSSVTVHGPRPLQPPPLHPSKAEPEAALALSVTTVPSG
jgi:hypothetical protein